MSILLKSLNTNPDITWNSCWLKPFESPWGILEKIKYKNFITSNDILRYWGIDKVKNLKTVISRVHRNLLTLNGLNDSLIQKSIGVSLHYNNQVALDKLLGPFSNYKTNPEKYLREEIHFCKECLKEGHHSLIFQCKFVYECPYHNEPLINGCVECHAPIPYIISDDFTEEPFLCKCGHFWLSSQAFNSITNSQNYEINSPSIKRWINLNDTEKEYLNRCKFFAGTNFENSEGVIGNILSILDSSYDTSAHTKTKTSSYLINLNVDTLAPEKCEGNLNSKIKYINRIEESWILLKGNEKYIDQYEYIYNSSRKIVSSIERHVRKSIYPEHKNCVKRLVGLLKEKDKSFPKLCPYAFAYVFWKQSIDGIQDFYKVDKYGYPDRGRINNVEIASVTDRPFVRDFINQWIDYYDEMGIYQLAGLNWSLNKLVGTLVLNHYYNWLSIAPSYAAKWEQANFENYKYQNLPFFTFILPKEKNVPIEFHQWENDNKYIDYSELVCPFPTKELKKIKPTEKKHTPLKLIFEKLG